MQKIVHLIFTLESGGSENMLVDIANEQAHYADVTIILINNKYSTPLVNRINKQVHFYSLNRIEGNKLSPMFLIRLWKLLSAIKPDVIHCHNHKIIQLLPWHRHKAVITIHCLNVPVVHLRKYKAVYAISQAVAGDLQARSGIRATVIMNGIDFSMVHPRDEQGSPHRPLRLVQISRMVHELKGQDLLLQAFRQLIKTHQHTNLKLHFIGSGPSMTYLQTLTARLELESHVCFLGEQSRDYVYEHLPLYDILLQPSRQEGFGLTLLEGIAAGLPVIASRLAGPAEILSDLPGGMLFEPGDVHALADTLEVMIRLIRQGRMSDRVEQSRKLIMMRYGIKRTALNYLQSYEQLLQPKAVTI